MPSKRFQNAFDRLARAEERFLKSEFLAPAVGGGVVRVRIAGVPCELRIRPPRFTGWGMFRPISHDEAELIRQAGLADRQSYLKLFPLVRLVLCRRDEAGTWRGLAAHRDGQPFHIQGLVPIRLADEAEQFETIRARFDGGNFWFEGADARSDPAAARYLRESLIQRTPVDELQRGGLSPEQRAAYAVHFIEPKTSRKKDDGGPPAPHPPTTEQRLREALAHAGAELKDFTERRDGYRVSYTIGGRRHTSSVSKEDMSVQVAGICLSGEDENFDLKSLIGVIREAEGAGEIVRIGEDEYMPEEQYWQIHPRPRRRRRR